jgi:hypothetical protein
MLTPYQWHGRDALEATRCFRDGLLILAHRRVGQTFETVLSVAGGGGVLRFAIFVSLKLPLTPRSTGTTEQLTSPWGTNLDLVLSCRTCEHFEVSSCFVWVYFHAPDGQIGAFYRDWYSTW